MKINIKSSLIIFSMMLLLTAGCTKSSESQLYIGNTPIDTLTIFSGIATPWEVLLGPDGYMWFTERAGRVSRLNLQTRERQIILTIPDVYEYGEGGLLGMALHPDFTSQPLVYLVYNYKNGDFIRERLVRYTWDGTQLDQQQILIDEIPANSYHDGSRLVFGPDGKLYMSTGDAGYTPFSQNLNSLAGKILRINPDGSIPDDNPFSGSYIWAWGLRNTQGMVFAPDGTLYASEHGPTTDDELNIIEKGRNYGWPNVEGFCNLPDEIEFCEEHNVREPLIVWTPTVAPAGIDYYNHPSIPEWQHSILMPTLKGSRLISLKLSDDGLSVEESKEWFFGTWGRLRKVLTGPNGEIYIGVSNRDGRGNPKPGDDRIVRIKPATQTGSNIFKHRVEKPEIYPNPIYGQGRVKWSGTTGTAGYHIHTASGALIASGEALLPEFNISTDMIKPGYYILTITGKGSPATVPFLVN